MFPVICTCELCGRVYRFDSRKGHTKTRCNSCRSSRGQLIKARKQELVALHGGGCEICGYDRCLAALTFHHVDPETKRFGVATSLSRSWDSLVDEASRCVLLCENCHREVHSEITEIPLRIRRRVEARTKDVQRRPRRHAGRPATS